MHVWNVLRAARWKYSTQKSPKSRHLGTIPQLCCAISSQLRHVSTIEKNLLSSNISSTCPHNTVNFDSLAAEIGPVVWGTPANFNGFRVMASAKLCGVEQRAPPIFGRAAITLGIGPHSSYVCTYCYQSTRHWVISSHGHVVTRIVYYCVLYAWLLRFVTRWGGPGGIEAYP